MSNNELTIDTLLAQLYPENYNEAAKNALVQSVEKVAEEFGEDAGQAFLEYLGGISEDAVFLPEDSAEKVASELPEEVFDKIAEYDLQGRIQAHAFLSELRKVASVGEEAAEELLGHFLEAVKAR